MGSPSPESPDAYARSTITSRAHDSVPGGGCLSPRDAPRLGGARAWLNWSLGVAFVVLVFTLQTGYAVTNVSVARDLGLDLSQVGLVGAVYTWAFALAQCATGSILDRLGTRWVLPSACTVVGLGAFVFAGAQGPGTLVLANLLTALGAAFGFVGAGFIGGQWFAPVRYGLMFSLVQCFGSLSAVTGQTVLGGLLGQSIPWTTLIRALGVIGLSLGALMLVCLRDPRPQRGADDDGVRRSLPAVLLADLAAVACRRETWVNALIGGATMGTMLGIGVVWGPRLLTAAGQGPRPFAVSSAAWLGLACGAPTLAWISDRMRRRALPMALACALQLLALCLLMLRVGPLEGDGRMWFFLFGFLAGGSMLAFTVGAEQVPRSLLGTSAAIVNGTQFVVGGIMMAVPGHVLTGTGLLARAHDGVRAALGGGVGPLSDHRWALACMPLSLAAALVLCLFLKDTYRHDGAGSRDGAGDGQPPTPGAAARAGED